MNTSTLQLDIALATPPRRSRASSRFPRGSTRAQWWFAHMHQVVDEANEPTAPAPEKTGLALPGIKLLVWRDAF